MFLGLIATKLDNVLVRTMQTSRNFDSDAPLTA
jgi:hypothetical protein